MLESLGNLAGAEFLPVGAFLGFFCKISTPGAFQKDSFFASLWSKVWVVQEGMSYLKSPARILIFWLKTGMYKVFQMRYYEALQTKGLQIYKPSKFTKTEDRPRPRASLEHSNFSCKWLSKPNNFCLWTLMAHNFAINQYWKSNSTSFERSDSYLFGGGRSRS